MHRQGRQRAHRARRQEGFEYGGQVSARGAPFFIAQRQNHNRSGLIRKPARRGPEPRGRLEDTFGVRTACWAAHSVDSAHAAPQLCDAFAGAWCGLALGAIDAGACRYFYDPDLYPCCRGAVKTDLQGPSSARLVIASAAKMGWAATTPGKCGEVARGS